MSKHSPLRTSPITIRSGLIRKQFLTSSRWETSPRPSTFGGRVSSRTTCSCRNCNSAESSIVTIRSSEGIKPDKIFRMVVFPQPVPPEIKTFRRASTIPRSNSAISGVNDFFSIRSEICNLSFENFLIEMDEPSNANGGIMAFTREPSNKRASHIGDDSSILRPTADTIFSMIFRRCPSSRNLISVNSNFPARST